MFGGGGYDEHGLPKKRDTDKKSAFAGLQTERKKDADRAWSVYQEHRNAGSDKCGKLLLEVFDGHGFSVPSAEQSVFYAQNWGSAPFTKEEHNAVKGLLKDIGEGPSRLLVTLSGRVKPGLLSNAAHGKADAPKWREQLEKRGLVVSEPAPKDKAKFKGDCLVRYTGPSPVALKWEYERREFLAMRLAHDQAMREFSQRSMRQYRSSDVIKAVVVSTEHCCDACRARFPAPYHPSTEIELPHPGCTASLCNCGVTSITRSWEEMGFSDLGKTGKSRKR